MCGSKHCFLIFLAVFFDLLFSADDLSREDLSGMKLNIESDSSNVVNWTSKSSIRQWYYHELFIIVARFSSHMGSVSFSHILRRANHMAGGLANDLAFR